MAAPKFEARDEGRIEEQRPLRADQIFEVLRREGEDELGRPAASLFWSGLAAGMAMGFSVVSEAALRSRLPADAGWSLLIGDMGYTVGFIIVILGRLQLFTENTITPVMPICHAPSLRNVAALLRIWAIVFLANMVGAALFATFVTHAGALSGEIHHAILSLGRHAVDGGFWPTVAKGIGAGFLIAALVWVLANQRSSELMAIFVVTYAIGVAGFAHVVAGAVEIGVLVADGHIAFADAALGFLLPALIGNMVGGTVLFTLAAYGQIRRELNDE